MIAAAVCGAVVFGVVTAVSGPTNAALSSVIGTVRAVLLSYAVSGATLLVVALALGQGDFTRIVEAAPWQLAGGISGSVMLLGMTVAVAALGTTLGFIVLMFGQLAAGIAIDALGLFDISPIPFGFLRIAGIVLVLVGIVLIYSGKKRADGLRRQASDVARGGGGVGSVSLGKASTVLVLAFAVGIVSSAQAPINASLGRVIGVFEASAINFIVGFAFLAAMLLLVGFGKQARGGSIRKAKPWQLLGGPYAATAVTLSTLTVPVLGTAVASACNAFGQLTMGSVIDAHGWFGLRVVNTNAQRLAGIALAAVGIAMSTIARLA